MEHKHTYVVGRRFIADLTSYPESNQYNFYSGTHRLVISLRTPTVSEVAQVDGGRASFGLVVEGPVMILLYKFGTMPWCDTPFSWHLVPADKRQTPPTVVGDESMDLYTFLVASETNILRAIRVSTWTPEFTQIINQAIIDQAVEPFDAATYDATLAATYRAYPTPEQLMQRANVRCDG